MVKKINFYNNNYKIKTQNSKLKVNKSIYVSDNNYKTKKVESIFLAGTKNIFKQIFNCFVKIMDTIS